VVAPVSLFALRGVDPCSWEYGGQVETTPAECVAPTTTTSSTSTTTTMSPSGAYDGPDTEEFTVAFGLLIFLLAALFVLSWRGR
jgi:hypothetical protein